MNTEDLDDRIRALVAGAVSDAPPDSQGDRAARRFRGGEFPTRVPALGAPISLFTGTAAAARLFRDHSEILGLGSSTCCVETFCYQAALQ